MRPNIFYAFLPFSHVPRTNLTRNAAERTSQSAIIAAHIPNIPMPRHFTSVPNITMLSDANRYARPTRTTHMETVETHMENFESPAALKTLAG